MSFNHNESKKRFLDIGHIPSLDGWRAISVILVFFAHSNLLTSLCDLAFYCGTIGVRFFFVISGFLITWLMLREAQKRGFVSLKDFYIRRCLRILPVYYIFLAVVAIIELYSNQKTPLTQWIACLTFTRNYVEVSYPTGHLWTLCVEEQFYLLWPFVFVGLGLHQKPKTACFILMGVLSVCPIIRGIAYLLHPNSYWIIHRFSFLIQADTIGWGCLFAIIMWTWASTFWPLISKYWYICTIGGILLIAFPWFTRALPGFNLINVPFAPSCHAVGFGLVMLSSIACSKQAVFYLLNTPAAVWIGVLSYSLYIWHVIVAPTPGILWRSNPLWLIPAFLIATTSYYALEKPFIGLRKKFLSNV